VTRILRVDPSGTTELDDTLAIEEPMEIRVGDKPLSVTMRTPGDDFDLAAGFLFTEAIVRDAGDIASIRHWGSPNVVRVALRDELHLDLQKLQRHFFASSSCGICGKATIDALRTQTTPLAQQIEVPREVIVALPDKLRAAQTNFDATGAIHAAGLFDREGTLLRVREDVGRHNAVDKVIGSFFREGRPLDDTILVVSGRAGFEIVQKAIVARIPMLAAVGAPSSLAVDLAREMHLALYGFVRGDRYNKY
jgi:FdhD protein